MKEIKTMTESQLWERDAELKEKMTTINDLVTAESRDLSDREREDFRSYDAERNAILRELQMRAADLTGESLRHSFDKLEKHSFEYAATPERRDAGAKLRDAITNNRGISIELRANGTGTGTTDAPGAISILAQDFIEPLNKGLILYSLGLRIKTGLTSNVKYPIMPTFEASFVSEKEIVTDTVIKDTALQPTPRRITVSAPLTELANLQTDGALYNWIINNLATAMARTLNRWLLQPTPIASGVYGVFAHDASKNPIKTIEFAGAVPTYAELVKMRGMVQGSGAYDDGTYAYTMSGAMAAELEATRRFDSGDTPILVDNKIGGAKVLMSEYIEATGNDTFNETPQYVGFGRFSDAIVAQFGTMKLTVDPYSQSKAAITNLVLDAYWAIDIIRKGSFVIGKPKSV